jgi:hypothetical protein
VGYNRSWYQFCNIVQQVIVISRSEVEAYQMGPEQNQLATRTNLTNLATSTPAPGALAAGSDWESHLYSGLRMAHVPGEVRAALASALGTMGVEAEYFLSLLTTFSGVDRPSHDLADTFLRRLDAAARRVYHAADTLEIATQGYLSALETGYPGMRIEDAEVDPWWPAPQDYEVGGESLELRMRTCGFAYRHVVGVYLANNVSAIASQMTLLLYTLTNLPPAGVLPMGSLYQGLYELSSLFQSYIVPHHIGDLDAKTPGLLTGIERLRRLDAEEDTSLQSDLNWAEGQLRSVQDFLNTRNISPAQREWAMTAAHEWQETIRLLTGLTANA